MRRQLPRFFDGLVNRFQMRQRLLVLHPLPEHIAAQIHDEQQVVEIVRDTAGQIFHQLALLYGHQFMLHLRHLVQVAAMLFTHLLKLMGLLAFLALEIIHIDRDAHAVQRLLRRRFHHLCRGVEPAVHTVAAHEPEVHASGLTVEHEVQKPAVGAVDVLRMDGGDPARVFPVFHGLIAIEVALERVVDPEHLTLGLGKPDMHRSVVDEVLHLLLQAQTRHADICGACQQSMALHGHQLASAEQGHQLQLLGQRGQA